MSEVPHLVPPGVLRFIERTEKRRKEKAEKQAAKAVKALAAGKIDQAIEALTGRPAPITPRIQRYLDRNPVPEPKPVTQDRSAAATAVRQFKVVEILTSGQRCSLNRAWKLAGYGNHRQSLDQLLSSPTVLDLFQRAVDQGKPLPPKYEARIRTALEDRQLGIA